MFAKAVAISALLAIANAGAPAVVQYSNPSVGVGGSNTVRGFAGLSSVTHQAKAVDSPFSTVRKTDTRVTNDAVAYASPVPQQVVQYAQPGVQYTQQAPTVQYAQQAPVQYTQQAPVQYTQQAPVQYAQPAVQYTQQPTVQYAQQPTVQYASAPVQYAAAPVQTVAKVAAAPAVTYAQPTYAAVSGPGAYYNYAPVQAAPAVTYAQQSVAAVSGPRPFYNYAPVAYASGPAQAVAYGTKTLSGAPVAVQQVAKVAAYPPPPATLQYHQPTVYAQQAVGKVGVGQVSYGSPVVAKVAAAPLTRAVPVAKTANLLGVNFSPISPQTASLHFNGFGTSYTLF